MIKAKNRIILNPGLTRCVRAYHNQAGLAAALGINKSTFSNWITRGRVPAEWGATILRLPKCRTLNLRLEDICTYLKQSKIRQEEVVAEA